MQFNTLYPVRQKYSVIIPCAGIGTRMKGKGPKALLEFRNKTILQRQIDILNEVLHMPEIIIVVGFEKEKFAFNRKNIKIVENPRYEITNVCDSIRIGLSSITTDNLVISYGDLIYNKELVNSPIGIESTIITSNTMNSGEVGCNVNNNNVVHMMYNIPNKWSQFAFITNPELDILSSVLQRKGSEKKYGFEVLNHIIEHGGTLRHYTNKHIRVIDIDSPKDLDMAATLIK